MMHTGRVPGAVQTAAGAITVERPGDATVLVRVSGGLDLALAPSLQRVLDDLGEPPPDRLVLDLTGLDFLASAGMAVLLRAHRSAAPATAVRLVIDNPVILRPLELTRLVDELIIVATLGAALADP